MITKNGVNLLSKIKKAFIQEVRISNQYIFLILGFDKNDKQ